VSTPLPMTAADPRPLWYKDAVIYQLHVKTFADSTAMASASSAQAVELDLQSLAGSLPIEMFGRTLFPRVGELPYMLTLAPYAFSGSN
jgi:hypothetical protein